jgi:hypothetical protein
VTTRQRFILFSGILALLACGGDGSDPSEVRPTLGPYRWESNVTPDADVTLLSSAGHLVLEWPAADTVTFEAPSMTPPVTYWSGWGPWGTWLTDSYDVTFRWTGSRFTCEITVYHPNETPRDGTCTLTPR